MCTDKIIENVKNIVNEYYNNIAADSDIPYEEYCYEDLKSIVEDENCDIAASINKLLNLDDDKSMTEAIDDVAKYLNM